ncbi:MAG: Gldg family protein [Gammaproteobacteria bacterium]|nr:Gldg family protein [Gammaproteobacteria bacterium]
MNLLKDKKLMSETGLVLLVLAFLAFTLLNHLIFGGLRIDLTEGDLYSLSDGSHEVIDSIDEPINLYFYFSDTTSKNLTALRAYARRVEELLREYESLADGKINLQIIDPEPFSDAEDQAAEFGLQAVPVNTGGDELYFGLVGTNALDNQEVITFFQPDKESFLEYDISKLINALVNPKKPHVVVMASMPVDGEIDMTTFQRTPPWVIAEQMNQLFDVEAIEVGEETLPEDTDLLVLIHPKGLSETQLYAIDQFVMNGGSLMVFVDPMAEMDRPKNENPMMPSMPLQQASDLNRLTSAWGVTLKEGKVLGDAQAALMVGGGGGAPVRHLAILGMQSEHLASDDVITANLGNVNLSTAGILEIAEPMEGREIRPLITSSTYSTELDIARFQFLANPEDLQKDFTPSGEEKVSAVRISGEIPSAFPDRADAEAHVGKTGNANVILVADTDLLTDRLWVQVQEFFGQRIASPFANNGDFVVNSLDNLVGSSALISIRSRGKFTRPFDVVQNLRREAETRYLEKARDLEARLSETEQKLTELANQKAEKNLLKLSMEQEDALSRFQLEKQRIRKQLREVQHQLNSDIETLGSWVKFINIALMPILLTLLLMAWHGWRKSRSSNTMDAAGRQDHE